MTRPITAVLFALAVAAGAPGGAQTTESVVSVIPRPARLTRQPGEFVLTRATAIVTDPATRDVGHALADALFPATGYRLPVRSAAGGAVRAVCLQVEHGLSFLPSAGYFLLRGRRKRYDARGSASAAGVACIPGGRARGPAPGPT